MEKKENWRNHFYFNVANIPIVSVSLWLPCYLLYYFMGIDIRLIFALNVL